MLYPYGVLYTNSVQTECLNTIIHDMIITSQPKIRPSLHSKQGLQSSEDHRRALDSIGYETLPFADIPSGLVTTPTTNQQEMYI